MDLKPEIWISSTSHLEAFDAILKDTPLQKKLVGAYNIPPDFPYMKQFFTKTPITYFSKGKLDFKDNTLRYNALKVWNNYLKNYCNLNDNLSLVLNRSSIKSIEWYPYKREPLNRFKWNWIRISCNEDVQGGDFLICADGVNNTNKLFEMLNQFKEGQTISTSLIDFSDSKIPLWGYIGLALLIIYFILDSTVTATYGTINGSIWGPTVVGILLLGMLLIFTSMIWYLTKMNENSKIQYQGLVFIWIILILSILNGIRNNFYH